MKHDKFGFAFCHQFVTGIDLLMPELRQQIFETNLEEFVLSSGSCLLCYVPEMHSCGHLRGLRALLFRSWHDIFMFQISGEFFWFSSFSILVHFSSPNKFRKCNVKLRVLRNNISLFLIQIIEVGLHNWKFTYVRYKYVACVLQPNQRFISHLRLCLLTCHTLFWHIP